MVEQHPFGVGLAVRMAGAQRLVIDQYVQLINAGSCGRLPAAIQAFPLIRGEKVGQAEKDGERIARLSEDRLIQDELPVMALSLGRDGINGANREAAVLSRGGA